jgi:phosphoglycolate phosphatase
MLRNLLLDWSGTLVDDLPPVIGATNFVLEKHGRPPLSREEFRQKFRLPFTEFYEEYLPDIPLHELDAAFHGHFVTIQDDVTPLPGLYEFLDFCRESGRRLFLLSSMKREHYEVQSAKLGLAHYFEYPYVGVLDKRAKIGEILERHGLDRDETAFVGDMIHDVETARHGGVMSIALLTGYDSIEKLTPSKPDVVVSSLDALRKLLQDPRQMNAGPDCIRINGLEVQARIGVPDEERAEPQKLIIDVVMESDFRGIGDDIARTTDYAAVAAWVREECGQREWRLLETLAEDLAASLLKEFPRVRAVTLQVRKFVLPQTRDVSVTLRREQS